MPSKLQLYAQLAEQTARQITGSLQAWTGFLAAAARLYKYPYHEQLMIYAQRPEATACADYELWNNTMHRYVRRGSRGISLIDTGSDKPRLRYVFDVSDTGGGENSRRPYQLSVEFNITFGELQRAISGEYEDDSRISTAILPELKLENSA